jgi:hypothetical protein
VLSGASSVAAIKSSTVLIHCAFTTAIHLSISSDLSHADAICRIRLTAGDSIGICSPLIFLAPRFIVVCRGKVADEGKSFGENDEQGGDANPKATYKKKKNE